MYFYRLVRRLEGAASLVLWQTPSVVSQTSGDILDALRRDETQYMLDDVHNLPHALEHVANLTQTGLSIYGLGIGSGDQGRPVIEVYAQYPHDSRQIQGAFVRLMGVERDDVTVVESTPFKGEVWAGDYGKHNAAAGRGTMGGYVRRQADPVTYVLSNNHVLARCNNAVLGDPLLSPLPATVLGTLEDFVPLVPLPQTNEIDAAIGRVAPGQPTNTRYPAPPSIQRSRRELRVEKWGARTQRTTGVIRSVYASVQILFAGFGNAGFRRMLRIEGTNGAFTAPGDSGSFVRSWASSRLLGLHVGGNGVSSFACRIQSVFAQLGLEI